MEKHFRLLPGLACESLYSQGVLSMSLPSGHRSSNPHCVTLKANVKKGIVMLNPAYFTLLALFTHGSLSANGIKGLFSGS